MTFNPFSVLTSKIFGGALAIALVMLALVSIDRNQWRAAARKADATLALVKPAQDLALAKAQAAIAAKEAQYKDQANAADQTHNAIKASTSDDADRFIAANRVPVCPASGPARTTPASPQGSGSSIPADLSASTVVSDSDVRACAGAVAYATAAHDWAMRINDTASGTANERTN